MRKSERRKRNIKGPIILCAQYTPMGEANNNEDEVIAKQQLRVKEMERKANFEQTQDELRRQKDVLQHLRRENKELRGALSQSAKGTKANSDAFSRREGELLKNKIYTLRRQLDDLKSANDVHAKHLSKDAEQVDVLHREAEPIISEDSSMAQKIRTLENRLDKSLIKHNEAVAIRRTYETILKRLRDERVGFDNQLAAIEKTLRAKEHDFVELKNMAHDAQHAKEIAKAEVQQFKAAYAEERRQKKKELEERKAFVQARMDQTIKQEKLAKQKKQQEEQQPGEKTDDQEKRKRELMQSTVELRTEEEQERLQQYAEAYRKIKEVTRATNVDEVIAKFIAQEDTHHTLVDMTRDVQAKIDGLQTQRSELRRRVEENKYSGTGQLGSRRIVDEFETHLTEAKLQLEKSNTSYEKTYRQFVGVKAGVEHLAEKLSNYRPEMQSPAITDENIVDVLKHCEQKLQMLVDEAISTSNETIEESLAHAEIELPPNNVRVKVGGDEREEEEEARQKGDPRGDAEDAEDDPHDRVALKQMSLSAVERENKKQKKRGRKKEGEAES